MGNKPQKIKKTLKAKAIGLKRRKFSKKKPKPQPKPQLDKLLQKYDISQLDQDKSAASKNLSGSDVESLKKKTNLSEEEIRNVFDKFLKANPSRDLTMSQFIELYSSLRNDDNVKEIAEFIFEVFDTDNNGHVSFQEFLIGYALTSKGDLKTRLEFTFDVYDGDSNGCLDREEIEDVIFSMLGLLGRDRSEDVLTKIAEECMERLDINKDGQISKDEFVNGLMNHNNLRELMCPFQ